MLSEMNITEAVILRALGRAENGIVKYQKIQKLLHLVDVSTDKDFQKMFNGFYRIRQRSSEWYDIYYNYMEKMKNEKNVNFTDTLFYFKEHLNRYEPSFSSKLISSLDTKLPVWDSYVLGNCGIKPPSYSDANRHLKSVQIYQQLANWYADYLKTDEARAIIGIFDENIGSESNISDIKKVDFVLWQIR